MPGVKALAVDAKNLKIAQGSKAARADICKEVDRYPKHSGYPVLAPPDSPPGVKALAFDAQSFKIAQDSRAACADICKEVGVHPKRSGLPDFVP